MPLTLSSSTKCHPYSCVLRLTGIMLWANTNMRNQDVMWNIFNHMNRKPDAGRSQYVEDKLIYRGSTRLPKATQWNPITPFTHTHTYVCVCIHKYIYVYIYIYVCIYIYAYIIYLYNEGIFSVEQFKTFHLFSKQRDIS